MGMGYAMGSLSELTGSHINLTVPSIWAANISDLKKESSPFSRERFASVRMSFKGFLEGAAALAFPPESALKLVSALTRENLGTPDMDSVKTGVLTEVGNIIISNVLGTMGNFFEKRLEYSIPAYIEGWLLDLIADSDAEDEYVILVINTEFFSTDLEIKGDVIIFVKVKSLPSFLKAVDSM